DGYLDTYFTFERKSERWKNLRDLHELYCAGHLMQAAVAFYRATGERKILDIACRSADHIISVFGPNKRMGVPGHPEVEMALVELYRTVGKKEYLDLAAFFVDNRGKRIIGGSPYHIDHEPFRELTEVVGHAVRALYLNCGATDIYLENGDKTLFDALMRLWHNLTEQKMYVTGGAGARSRATSSPPASGPRR
ncbi:MAG: glycoside hydrolase family 127 protein, partial [Thermoplasmata archaeon]